LQPEREDEMARIEAAGGRVIYWNGYRVLGVLAMSRAIGMGRIFLSILAERQLCWHTSVVLIWLFCSVLQVPLFCSS